MHARVRSSPLFCLVTRTASTPRRGRIPTEVRSYLCRKKERILEQGKESVLLDKPTALGKEMSCCFYSGVHNKEENTRRREEKREKETIEERRKKGEKEKFFDAPSWDSFFFLRCTDTRRHYAGALLASQSPGRTVVQVAFVLQEREITEQSTRRWWSCSAISSNLTGVIERCPWLCVILLLLKWSLADPVYREWKTESLV